MGTPQDAKTRVVITNLALAALLTLLLIQAYLSTNWRMEHDTPLFHYAAFLMDHHGRFPYRDIFETSMPGAFAFHYLIVKLFGYGDHAFRAVDLVLLVFLFVVTFLFMRRFGRVTGLAAPITFGLIYLSKGQTLSLQRDYLGIIPLACALLLIPSGKDKPVTLLRFASAGFCFGIAAMFKPHLVIGMPIVLAALLAFRRTREPGSWPDFFRCIAALGAGFMLPIIGGMLWLWRNDALLEFLKMTFNYLPLHVMLTGAQENLAWAAWAFYLVEQTLQFGGYAPMVLCSVFASYYVATHKNLSREYLSFGTVFLLAFLYLLYPTLAGKFWDYHYLPTAYFLSLACSLCLIVPRTVPEEGEADGDSARSRLSLSKIVRSLTACLPAVIFIVGITIQLNLPKYYTSVFAEVRNGSPPRPPKAGRVDEIAGWLAHKLGPSDVVQPLDWTDGVIHAMLLAQSGLATEFMYDYHFYHHQSSPTVQHLRQTFLEQLRESRPRFIIETKTNKPWIPGGDPALTFPELQHFIQENYGVATRTESYVIYERRPDVIAP
jgi:hypothetical protein